jgi:DNA processing protein
MKEETRHQIALTQISQIGDITIKKLLEHFGSATEIFKASRRELECIGPVRASLIRKFDDYKIVDKELRFIEQHQIKTLFYTDPLYPKRLQHCADGPALLYYKGNADLNASRIVNVIGTRRPSEYGKRMCSEIVKELTDNNITVISGLAYGVDITAHRTAVENNAPTIGILAHGLDRIYPTEHEKFAAQMTHKGGLLTEFLSGTLPDRQNFPKRNRIVAGMADATVVVESGIKGGSMITVDIANSYNRDVMAVPGRIGDTYSSGCLELIKTNKAMLITGAADLMETMGWSRVEKPAPPPQQELFVTLSEEELQIASVLEPCSEKHFSDICREVPIPGSQVARHVQAMTMRHVIKALPGGMYQLA